MNDVNRLINNSLFDSTSLKNLTKNLGSHNIESTTSATNNETSDEYISPLEQTFADLRRKYVAAAGPQFGVTEMEYSSSVSFGDVDFDDSLLLNQRAKGNSGRRTRRMRAERLRRRRTWGWDDDDTAYTWGRMNLEKRRTISNTQNLASGYSRCISTADLYVSYRSSTSMSPNKINSTKMRRSSSTYDGGMNSIRSPTASLHERTQSSLVLNQGNMSSPLLSMSYLNQLEQKNPTPKFIDDSNVNTTNAFSPQSSSHAENLLSCAPHLRHLCVASAQMQGANYKSSRNPLSFLMRGGISSSSPTTASTSKTANIISVGDHHGVGSSSASLSSLKSTNVNAASIAEYEICLDHEYINELAALKLADFVKVLSHEMSPEEFADVEDEISSHVLTLMHSKNREQKLAGVAAIDALIDIPSADEEKKMIKFSNNLSYSLKNFDVDYMFLSSVTRSLGKIFLGSSNVDYVEYEVNRAMECLRNERSDRR